MNRWQVLVHVGGVAVLGVLACAPKPKTVANVSIGNTGCPPEDLAVFNYVAATRSWRAACNDKLYVCSDVRGATRCTPQEASTHEAELMDRAKLLLTLDAPRRDLFIGSDIRKGTWEQYSASVVAVSKLNAKQIGDVDEGQGVNVFAAFSDDFAAQVNACDPKGITPIQVKPDGTLIPRAGSKTGCFFKLMASPELAWMHQQPNEVFWIPSAVYGVKPLPRPAAPAPAATVEPPPPPAPEAPAADINPDVEGAVRGWLDEHAEDVLTCTAENTSAVMVTVDDKGEPKVALKGKLAGKAEERCVRAALGQKQFAPGPVEVMHLVKKPK